MIKKSVTIFLLVLSMVILNTNCHKDPELIGRDYMKPGSPEYLMNEAYMNLNAGRMGEAERLFTKSLEKSPNLTGALYGLAIIYLNQRQFEKSERYFRRVLQLRPDTIDVHNYLGVIYSEMDNYDKAKEHLLIAANSENYRTPENAFANLAMLEIRYKKFQSAKRYVEKGLIKNNEFAPLLNALGIILEEEGNYSEAIFNYEKALVAEGRDNLSYLVNMGRVYKKMGKKEKALDALERALSSASTDNARKQIRVMIQDLDK